MTDAVMVVPGIMGSVLKCNGTTIWPGSLAELVLPYQHMKQLLSADVEATDIIRSFAIVEQYGALLDALNACGYREKATPPTLRVFPYDWRGDNATTAGLLAKSVDEFARSLGADASISLVAHSMGGLICRSYLESGSYVKSVGFSRVKQLITLGTPHRGAAEALPSVLGQERAVFLSKSQALELARCPKFPAAYQLLPPRGEPYASDHTPDSRLVPVDVYDSHVASQLGLVQANLDAAASFHATLNVARKPAHVRYFFFAGTQRKTTTSVKLRRDGTMPKALKIERDDGGDGTVPVWSSSLTGVQMEPVGGKHSELYKNGVLQRVLGDLLGKPDVLLATGLVPELTISDTVVEPDAQTVVTIDFPRHTSVVHGELRTARLVDADGVAAPSGLAPVPAGTIRYDGPEIDHLAVLFTAPHYPGIYEVTFAPAAEAPVAARLIVQTES